MKASRFGNVGAVSNGEPLCIDYVDFNSSKETKNYNIAATILKVIEKKKEKCNCF